jgi:SHS family sialic acid transporter-like MFS transporter
VSQEKTLTRTQWIVLAAAFLGWMFDGVEIGLFPLVVRPAMQDLGMTDDAAIARWNSVVVACFLLGAACGGLVFGWLGDKLGRVRAMVASVLAYSLFTGACWFATSPWQLGVLRFIASMGMGGEWALAVALVMECWPERHRPKLAGAIGAAANLGFLFIGLVAMAKPVTRESWRWMMLVGASPAALALAISLFVPESERWKESVKWGGVRPLREIFSGRLRKMTFFAIVFSAIPLIGTWAAVAGWIPMWVDQMTEAEMARTLLAPEQMARFDAAPTPKARHELLKGCLTSDQWRAVGQRTARAKATVSAIMAVASILVCFLAPMAGGIWGRRPTYFVLCALALGSCAYLFRALDRYDWQFMVTAFLVGGITGAFYGWLPLYLPELFPTRVRATGQGLSFNFGRILAALGTLYMGKLVELFGGDYGRAMAGITLVYLLGMVLIWWAPETKGKPLPE